MENRNLIILIIVGLIFYMSMPIPYCKSIPVEELVSELPETVFTQAKMSEIRNELDEFGFINVQTWGESMNPTILSNSQCYCEKKNEYSVGDIVLYFASNNQGIAHRLIYKNNDDYFLRGDNNNFTDVGVKESQLICSIPEVKRWEVLWK